MNMSLNLFHVILQEILRIINEGNFPRSIGQIENHLSVSIQDASFEEKQFMPLMIFVDVYQNALKNELNSKEKSAYEGEKEMIGKAIKSGKQVVEFSENIRQVLKKEELDVL